MSFFTATFMKNSIRGSWTGHLSELPKNKDKNSFGCDPQDKAVQEAISYLSLFSTSLVACILIFLILLLFRRTSALFSLHKAELYDFGRQKYNIFC